MTSFIRKYIFLYIIFIEIYKKFITIFKFIEGDQYKFIKYSKIKNVIDVGSNNFHTARLILNYKNVKVFCYDPIKLSNQDIKKFKKKLYLTIMLCGIKMKKKNFGPLL